MGKGAYVQELHEHSRELSNIALLRQGGDDSCVFESSLLWWQLVAATPLWRGLSEHCPAHSNAASATWSAWRCEMCFLSSVGLWQLFKCKLNMLGLALQNISKQELPLNSKMEILLLKTSRIRLYFRHLR